MIQFNLLPEVKLDYLKTERTKRTVFSISLIVSGVSLAIILLLFSALELQSRQVNTNKKTIKTYSDKLTNTTDVNKILTVQNQLKTVVNLYNQSPVTTRLYDYLPEIVPVSVSIGSLSLDLTTDTMNITGTAASLETVNTFADTLKFAGYTSGQNSSSTKAFKNVVLNSFSVGQNSASYSLSLQFAPILYDRTQNVKLAVPANYISTRSFTQLPSQDLFKSSTDNSGTSAQ